MAVRVAPEGIDMVLHSLTEDNSVITRHIPVPAGITDPMKGVEEAVYDAPLLLADFNRTDCVVDAHRYILLPSEGVTPEVVEALTRALYPDDADNLEAIVNPLSPLDCTLVAWIPLHLAHFLRRTFNNPPIIHHLTPFCRYFAAKSKLGNSGKMYANFRQGYVDLIAFGHNGLLAANSYRVRENTDSLYYIMALRKEFGFDGENDQLLICGEPEMREAMIPLLREYVPYVMPVIFPSTAIRGGEEATRAPFNLIVLPLCE